jgi:putative endonuclease
VLHSRFDNGLCIGYSADLKKLLKQHEAGISFATSYRGPWTLIYYEAYLEEADALGWERYLKAVVADGCYECNLDTISGIDRSVPRCERELQPRKRSFYADLS